MSGSGAGRIRPREAAVAAAFFLAATVLATWPMAGRAGTGSADVFDAKLTAWILHWDFHQTFRDPFRLFDANIFHPARDTLAFSENLYGAAIFGFPLYAAGVSTLAAHNLIFLLGMCLSGLAAWMLAREVTGDPGASLLAGVVYALAPWRISQIPHIQFQWGAFLPLLLLFFLRFLRGGALRDRVLFAVCLVWNALCNVHYAFFSAALLAVAGTWAWMSGGSAERRRVLGLLPAAAAAALLVALFFLPYFRVSRLYGFERSSAEAETFSGRPGDFLSAGSRNWLYGSITRQFAKPEGDFFPGLVPFALALLAFRVTRRRISAPVETADGRADPVRSPGRMTRGIMAALNVVLLLLAVLWVAASLREGLRLGPLRLGDPSRLLVLATATLLLRLAIGFPRGWRYRNLGDFIARGPLGSGIVLFAAIAVAGAVIALGLHTPYYRFLFDSFGPLLRGIRAPSRGIVLFHLGLGVLAAAGLSGLLRRRSGVRRGLLLAAVLAAVGIEYRAWPIKIYPVEAEPAPVYRWLARKSIPPAVMEWPLGFPFDFEYEFRSTAHWKPIVNGASGFAPPKYFALWMEARKSPVPEEVWDRVRDVEASVLVFHPHDAASLLLRSTLAAVRSGLASGRLEILETFPHGPDTDFVFRVTTGPRFDAGVSPDRRRAAEEAFAAAKLRPGIDPWGPVVVLDFPPAGAQVSEGQWAYGWAADDSGIARVRVTTESGDEVPSTYGGDRPDVAKMLWGFADSERPGLHFAIPDLPPGEHVLIVTAEAVDGGATEVRRPIQIR